MKKIKVITSVLLAITLVFSIIGVSAFAENDCDIVILYTNDVHCAVDSNIGYAGLAAYKAKMQNEHKNVALVDAGDAIQGKPLGTISKGSSIVDIMNKVGYDFSAVGNHEFDFGMDNLQALMQKADYKYLSCNIYNLITKETLTDAYSIADYNGTKVAYVGISTPYSLSSSNPANFKDKDGNFIYGFCEGENGNKLYTTVQSTVDAARAAGANYVIGLAHMGTGEEYEPYGSDDLIKNTSGFDAVIDGHSHSVVEADSVKDKSGKNVVVTQTGTELAAIGQMTITNSGISAKLVSNYDKKDAETEQYINQIKTESDKQLNVVIAKTDYDLLVNDPTTGNRIIRTRETNLGDMCADAYKASTGADIAFVNGGGVRADIKKGDITYKDIFSVHPFGNVICMVNTTGRQIIDALETSSRFLPEESGAFLHTSGLSYCVNTSISSSVKLTDQGQFIGVFGKRRVYNVKVYNSETSAYEPIVLDKHYKLASINYIIKSGGDGLSMFMEDETLAEEVAIDNQSLIEYITQTQGGKIGEEYADPYGNGRIYVQNHKHVFENDVCKECNTLLGDADSDSLITAKDVLLLRKTLAAQFVLIDYSAVDMNSDSKITTADILMLRKALAQIR